MTIRTKRIYEDRAAGDGARVLVDRIWPRGVSREAAGVDLWLKEVAPSTELRRWFGHEPERWPEFRERYRAELRGKGPELDRIHDLERRHGTVTLVYSARDEARNQAVVLAELLAERGGGPS